MISRHPAKPAGGARQPRMLREIFVGNTCVADNVAECAKIAIWNALGDVAHNVTVAVEGEIARLDGTVTDSSEREAAERAALSLSCVARVDNRLRVVSNPARHHHIGFPRASQRVPRRSLPPRPAHPGDLK